MREEKSSPGQSPLAERGSKAAIVERLYDVALDPIRLGDLLEVWEGQMAPLRRAPCDSVSPVDDPEITAHIARASVFLDRYKGESQDPGYRRLLDDIPRSAAFVCDGGPGIEASNQAATVVFGLGGGAGMADLPFDPDDIALLRDVVRQVAAGHGGLALTMRIRSLKTGAPVILRVSPVDSDAVVPLALVLSTELVWPDGFAETVMEAFGLTAAEVAIVRGITMGQPLREIAAERKRSPETVRTQLRSILSKTETHSQPELVRVVLGLMDVSTMQIGQSPGPERAAKGALSPLAFRQLRLNDGRRLEFLEFGDPGGAPCLYMHLDYGLVRWPQSAEAEARRRGIRVVVPVRAGYGDSDPLPLKSEHVLGCAMDYAAVLDHLGIGQATVLALGADLRFAMQLASLRPDLVRAILGCAAQLPLHSAAQYERMDKWQRFILANARYAPRILPFLVKAGFSLARRLGKEAFFAQVNGGSPADMETFARPEVREAMLVGSEVSMSDQRSAHEAFARECISSERDWSGLVRGCKVPVVLLQGDQDPQTPVETIRELMQDYPHIEVRFLPRTGQLLFFKEWRLALDVLQDLQAGTSG